MVDSVSCFMDLDYIVPQCKPILLARVLFFVALLSGKRKEYSCHRQRKGQPVIFQFLSFLSC